MNEALWAFGASLVVSVAAGPSFIRWARSAGGQPVRAAGPASHLAKIGTPTMGGVLFVAVTAIIALAVDRSDPAVDTAVGLTVLFGAIGFLDDIAKVRRQASLGLRARTKLAFGLAIATTLAVLAMGPLEIGTYVRLPGLGQTAELAPWLFVVLVNVVVLGATNAVNLTDGLDGLAGGTGIVAVGFYAALAYASGAWGLGLFAVVLTGAVAGFLYFNLHPARMIMGDTGSMGIGAAIAALAVLTRSELILPVVGLVFVVEALSVIIQVLSFRLTGRRVFRMSPLHHHFELSGWAETTVVRRFWICGILAAALAYLLWW